MIDDEPVTHRVEYVSTFLVRRRERRWIDVDDNELASLTAAQTDGTDALHARLDDLWEHAWNSGTAHRPGDNEDDEPLAPGDEPRPILKSASLPDGPIALNTAPPAPETPRVKDVHTEHCCALHGCKYGRQDCTVLSGERQSYPCEGCGDDVAWSSSALDRRADGTVVLTADGRAAQRRGGSWFVAGSTQPLTSDQLLAGRYVRIALQDG